MATARKLSALGRLLASFEEEEIRFTLIGMSAAIMQGVMESTLDVDLWMDLPARQYMRLQNIAIPQGGAMGARTVSYLADGTPVIFVFEVDGLGSFASERKHTRSMRYHGRRIAVLKLERILKSKQAIQRDKDLPHIIHIKNVLRIKKHRAAAAKAGRTHRKVAGASSAGSRKSRHRSGGTSRKAR